MCCGSESAIEYDKKCEIRPFNQQSTVTPLKIVPYEISSGLKNTTQKKKLSSFMEQKIQLETPKKGKYQGFRRLSGRKKSRAEREKSLEIPSREINLFQTPEKHIVPSTMPQSPLHRPKAQTQVIFDNNPNISTQRQLSIQPSIPSSAVIPASGQQSKLSMGRTKLSLGTAFQSRMEPVNIE